MKRDEEGDTGGRQIPKVEPHVQISNDGPRQAATTSAAVNTFGSDEAHSIPCSPRREYQFVHERSIHPNVATHMPGNAPPNITFFSLINHVTSLTLCFERGPNKALLRSLAVTSAVWRHVEPIYREVDEVVHLASRGPTARGAARRQTQHGGRGLRVEIGASQVLYVIHEHLNPTIASYESRVASLSAVSGTLHGTPQARMQSR